MKRTTLALLLSGAFACAAFSTVAVANAGPKEGKSHKHMHKMMLEKVDADGDGKVSEAEITAHRTSVFNEIDADGDGSLTKAEISAHHEKKEAERRAEMEKKRAERQDKMFAHLDEDGNGTASLEEFLAKGPGARFDKMDKNDDGFISKDEIGRKHKYKKDY